MSEHYSWWEQNILFSIADQARIWDIPAITKHDAFIIPENDKEMMMQIMYSTSIPEIFSQYSLI